MIDKVLSSKLLNSKNNLTGDNKRLKYIHISCLDCFYYTEMFGKNKCYYHIPTKEIEGNPYDFICDGWREKDE